MVGLERDPELLDPNFARHVVAESVGQALFDALIMVDLDGELVPGLAESYEFTRRSYIGICLAGGGQLSQR